MELNKSGMIPIVGNTYLLNFAELCSYSIELSDGGDYPTLSELCEPNQISESAENYVSEWYGMVSSTSKNYLVAPYQYSFRPEKLEDQSGIYTMVKYIGAGCFVDLITNNFITMYDLDIDMMWERRGVNLDDLNGIEKVHYLEPDDFEDFNIRYNTLLKSPLAINSEFDGLETIDQDNLSNLINCDVQKICEIESKLIEQARQILQSQYNKIINIDHAIALEETKLMEETGLKIK